MEIIIQFYVKNDTSFGYYYYSCRFANNAHEYRMLNIFRHHFTWTISHAKSQRFRLSGLSISMWYMWT